MFRTRPVQSARASLIDLTTDTWTSDDHYYGNKVSYPIAEKAASLLREQDALSDEHYHRLVQSLRATNNLQVKYLLLRAMVRHGSTERQGKLINIAIQDRNPSLSLLVAEALFVESSHIINNSQLDVISDEVITSAQPRISCWLVLLLCERGMKDRSINLAQNLAKNKDRCVLLALIYLIGLDQENSAPIGFICHALSSPVIQILDKLHQSQPATDLSPLNEFGDVRTVEAVKNIIKTFYTSP